MKNSTIALVISVLALIGVGFVAVREPAPVQFGATPGGDFTNQANFLGGVVNSTNISTSTNSSATITANEFRGWSRASVVSLIPNVTTAAVTFTLPASSTVPDLVPRAGDRATFCIRNATTTAGIYMTLAGGTGTNLVVASSSISALGGTKLVSGKTGCITLIRQVQTATTFDIDALLTVYQ